MTRLGSRRSRQCERIHLAALRETTTQNAWPQVHLMEACRGAPGVGPGLKDDHDIAQ